MELSKAEIIGALVVLGSVISALWILLNGYIKKDKERLTRYEEINTESNEKVINLTGDYRELKGRVDAVETLSKQVINEIQNIGNKNDD